MRFLLVAALVISCDADAKPREVVVGGPCADCDAVFIGRPAKLAARARIARPLSQR